MILDVVLVLSCYITVWLRTGEPGVTVHRLAIQPCRSLESSDRLHCVVTRYIRQTLPICIFCGVFVYMEYLCRPSEASTWYCAIPGGYPPQDWQSLPCAGEELDSNPGLLILQSGALQNSNPSSIIPTSLQTRVQHWYENHIRPLPISIRNQFSLFFCCIFFSIIFFIRPLCATLSFTWLRSTGIFSGLGRI